MNFVKLKLKVFINVLNEKTTYWYDNYNDLEILNWRILILGIGITCLKADQRAKMY